MSKVPVFPRAFSPADRVLAVTIVLPFFAQVVQQPGTIFAVTLSATAGKVLPLQINVVTLGKANKSFGSDVTSPAFL
jgi:hypothetical protein